MCAAWGVSGGVWVLVWGLGVVVLVWCLGVVVLLWWLGVLAWWLAVALGWLLWVAGCVVVVCVCCVGVIPTVVLWYVHSCIYVHIFFPVMLVVCSFDSHIVHRSSY